MSSMAGSLTSVSGHNKRIEKCRVTMTAKCYVRIWYEIVAIFLLYSVISLLVHKFCDIQIPIH